MAGAAKAAAVAIAVRRVIHMLSTGVYPQI